MQILIVNLAELVKNLRYRGGTQYILSYYTHCKFITLSRQVEDVTALNKTGRWKLPLLKENQTVGECFNYFRVNDQPEYEEERYDLFMKYAQLGYLPSVRKVLLMSKNDNEAFNQWFNRLLYYDFSNAELMSEVYAVVKELGGAYPVKFIEGAAKKDDLSTLNWLTSVKSSLVSRSDVVLYLRVLAKHASPEVQQQCNELIGKMS